MNQLKIVFMGTATFSEAVLKNLIQHDYNSCFTTRSSCWKKKRT